MINLISVRFRFPSRGGDPRKSSPGVDDKSHEDGPRWSLLANTAKQTDIPFKYSDSVNHFRFLKQVLKHFNIFHKNMSDDKNMSDKNNDIK